MFPIPFNFPFRKKDGSVTTIDDAISSGGGGGGGYVLPPATNNTLGGVKIGSGVTVQNDGTISVSGGGGSYTPDYENERLIIGVHGDYNYFIPMEKEYIGSGAQGYEIKTNPASSSSAAKIDIYDIIYADGEVISSELIKTLVHNGDYNYDDDNISVTYNNANWVVTSKVSLYDESGTIYTSPLSWSYATVADYVMLLESPV